MNMTAILHPFRGLRDRFVRCAMHSGSDRSFAEGACLDFDVAVNTVELALDAANDLAAVHDPATKPEQLEALAGKHLSHDVPTMKELRDEVRDRLARALEACERRGVPITALRFDPEARFYAAHLMISQGGGFVGCIGDAWFRADPTNRQRLEVAFPDYFGEYEKRVAAMSQAAAQSGGARG